MKYALWFVRLVFAAWMIPAGLNHFVPLFPQPMGSQPLSHELVVGLIDSHLFDLVKAVEFVAGVSALTGFYTPLGLILCMPVSFCVFYWDAPLEGWGSRASIFGYAALLCNLLLCLAYVGSYRSMLVLRSKPDSSKKQLVLIGRLILGAWMLASGASFFFYSLWPMPTGHEPLAIQLMAALVHSRLLNVAMAIQLIAGALILTGFFVPLALCVLMPVSTCALYWSLILDHQPLAVVLALAAFALNGLLMLAYLEYYKGALQRHAPMLGESPGERMSFDSLFVNHNGRTSRGQFGTALIPLLAVVVLYVFAPIGRSGQWSTLVLLFPALVLHARRLHDMGHTVWPLLVPAGLMVASFAIWLHLVSFGAQLDSAIPLTAIAVSAGFALWGCIGRGQAEANSFGTPAAA
jgi:uncharacterized membrane protein YhaH (DUF805 family)/uncharacterized membrane protein YphA (DoxX/SURF4 family)